MSSFRPASFFLACVFLFSTLITAQTRPEFIDAPAYPVLKNPSVLATGDFNGDGNLDLVESGAGMTTLLGNGDGTFRPGKNSAMSESPNSIAVADFNRDGKLDVVTTDFQDNVSVSLGSGDGSFHRFVNYAAGRKPTSVVVADFNGDSNPDLVVTDTGVAVNLLAGNGDGTFQAGIPINAGTFPGSLATGDFNGDQKADLAVATASGVSILLGNGNGTFQTPIQLSVAAGSMAIADFNNDLKSDLAVTNGLESTVSILLGDGDGTFQSPQVFPDEEASSQILTGDFNGDHKMDVATRSYYVGAVSVLLGNGDGSLGGYQLYGAGAGLGSLAVGAFNQDGTDDIAAINPANYYQIDSVSSVSILLGNRNGTLRARPVFETGRGTYKGANAEALGDLNNDGEQDVVMVSFGTWLCNVMINKGDGRFRPHQDFATGDRPNDLALGDFNNDGNLDVVTANWGDGHTGSVSVLLGDGHGALSAPQTYSLPTARFAWDVAAGDFTGDGFLDVLVTSRGQDVDESMILYPGRGDGRLASFRTIAHNPNFYSPVATDMNGDGRTDIVVLSGPDGGKVFLGNGDGTFQSPLGFPINVPETMRVVDFNHDGKLDVVTGNLFNTISVLFGNGDGTFQSSIDSPSSPHPLAPPSSIDVSDLNGDGKMDVVVGQEDGYGHGEFVGVLWGNGDGTLKPGVDYEVGLPSGVLANDFNGDGAPDIAVAVGSLDILLNAGGTSLTIQSSNNPSRLGDDVTFTANVRSTFPGVGSPRGRVRFEDGKTIISTANLTNGVAQFTTSALAVGNHRMDAVYEGDVNFNRHKSDVLVQQVLP